MGLDSICDICISRAFCCIDVPTAAAAMPMTQVSSFGGNRVLSHDVPGQPQLEEGEDLPPPPPELLAEAAALGSSARLPPSCAQVQRSLSDRKPVRVAPPSIPKRSPSTRLSTAVSWHLGDNMDGDN